MVVALPGGPLWGWGLLLTEVARVLRDFQPDPRLPAGVCPDLAPCPEQHCPAVSCSCPEQHCPSVSCPAPAPQATWDPPAVVTTAGLTVSLALQLGIFCTHGRRIAPRRAGGGVLARA